MRFVLGPVVGVGQGEAVQRHRRQELRELGRSSVTLDRASGPRQRRDVVAAHALDHRAGDQHTSGDDVGPVLLFGEPFDVGDERTQSTDRPQRVRAASEQAPVQIGTIRAAPADGIFELVEDLPGASNRPADIEHLCDVDRFGRLRYQFAVAAAQLRVPAGLRQQFPRVRFDPLGHRQPAVAAGADQRQVQQRRHRLPQIELGAEEALGVLDCPGVGERPEPGEQLAGLLVKQRQRVVQRSA